MTALSNDPLERIKRKATLLILAAMASGGLLLTILNSITPNIHFISLIIPPLSTIVCAGLCFYLLKQPHQSPLITKLMLAWSAFIIIFPEYFFIAMTLIDPSQRLVDTLPPFAVGIFLLTNCIIIFLNPQEFGRLTIGLWAAMAAPIVVYLLFHPQELVTPRGIDLMVTLLPAMGMNVALIVFYTRLQEKLRQLDNERFYLKEVAERDALTGVYNRRAGEQILQDLIRSQQEIGLILCDIDHFKQVNDVHGHLMGDQVLQLVAQCFQTHLRKQDLLMRWGGEEFLIAVIGDDMQELTLLAERLCSQVASQSIPTVGNVTASFGVALRQPLENLIQLFDRADQALYQAKDAGRNQVILAST
jgi:diguanylate cyclase (GGDEF)-like protein